MSPSRKLAETSESKFGQISGIASRTVTGTPTDACMHANSHPMTLLLRPPNAWAKILFPKFQLNQPHDRVPLLGSVESQEKNLCKVKCQSLHEFPTDFNLRIGEQFRFTLNNIDFIFFHKAGNPVPHFIHYIILVLMCLG